jgi:hypothetical protein
VTEFLGGVWGFFKVTILVLTIVELSMLIEEFISARLELRRGFAGTQTSPLKIFARHGLKVLRVDGSISQHIGAGAKFLIIFLAAGLLPIWSGEIPLNCAHSLWVFTALTIVGPAVHLILEWTIKRGAGWPSVLVTAERSLGTATVHFVLAMTLVAMTGIDNFADFRDLQLTKSWMILRYPWIVLILFAYAVASLFTSFQTIFAREQDERASGWSFDGLLPQLRRTVWTLFMVDVFLGGSGGATVVGDLVLIFKCVSINTISYFGSKQFFNLREDQAESFILWRLTPIAIFILAISLLFPGGLF